MTKLGFDIESEMSVSGDRLDAVLKLDGIVYVFEFKYADCPKDADEDTKRVIFEKALDEGERQQAYMRRLRVPRQGRDSHESDLMVS